MPTRHIDSSPVKLTGTLPDGHRFESSLEEDFYALLSFNPRVESFETQPVQIFFAGPGGKRHKYTPDVLVHFKTEHNGRRGPTVLGEVKPDVLQPGEIRRRHFPRRDDPELDAAKWEAAQRYAQREGWQWKIYRESEIRTPYLRNVKFLRRAIERPGSDDGKAPLLTALATLTKQPPTLGHLINTLCATPEERGRFLPTWYRLIATGEVVADLHQLLTLQTVLSLPGQVPQLPSPCEVPNLHYPSAT